MIGVPNNIDECMQKLDAMLIDSDKIVFIEESEDSICSISHHTFGRRIRNSWGLWDGDSELATYFKSFGVTHPDDMSHIIITSYWRHMNNKPLNFDEQVAEIVIREMI